MKVTQPVFPRPDQNRLQCAIGIVFQIIGFLAPREWIKDDTLIRAIIFRGASVSEATWAIHELTLQDGFLVRWVFETGVCLLPVNLITSSKPPAGLAMALGSLHLGTGPECRWGGLVFSPNHEILETLRQSMNVSDNVTDMSDMTDSERTIAESIGDKTMNADAISKISGYPNNSQFRNRLSQMVKRGILVKIPRQGYRLNQRH